MYAVVEPGVVTAKFAAAAYAQSLFYPPGPGSQAVSTLGGNAAENAGGLRGLKYGVTRNHVMGLQFFERSFMSQVGLSFLKAASTVDARSIAGPGPILEAKKGIGKVKVGEVSEILSGHMILNSAELTKTNRKDRLVIMSSFGMTG